MLHNVNEYAIKTTRANRLCITLLIAACTPLSAATLCVNPGGTGGCFSKIQQAVNAAGPNDTIKVAPGTYKEAVTISTPLSLVGAGRDNTIINAKDLPNGININGKDHARLGNVVVSGFTVENANFEGILITNAFSITIWNNRVIQNNQSLDISTVTCPGIPPFETAEGFDCGEGIHLTGVYYSTVTGNIVQNNAGGILLSDETGPTHDNLIANNVVKDNPFDCGITLASHPPASGTGKPLKVFHNTIANNQSSHNGTKVPGAGAGVGMFGFLPGATVSSNVVINNVLTDNGLPGVAFHGHAPGGEILDDNVIVGNYIAGNGADTDDAATPGPAGINIFGVSPIHGTIISRNVIDHEAAQVVINTPAEVEVHLNNFLDDTLGVDNLSTGTVDATENWWACPAGPGGAEECANVGGPGVLFEPWLTSPLK
ncbi:MAG: right-handed parallel beta-helix repeat-containing protein [Acidobacteriaceae bacterium]|nr:right-handed parallel beta-helix repeat-containing protein [Acidobacteriaceae bacterium]MBV8571743.1 right-handed parallel beta-helix repeat-containing protein [Acidobacteriaceae bacterium]